MNVSHVAASRTRRVDDCVFFSDNVRHRTQPEPTPPPYAWKRSLEDRIWSAEGPSSLAARAVLVTILRHADASGRAWISIPTIRAKTGIGSTRTVRNALDTLAREGWLQVTPQTWASLKAEQTAAGRPGPRRDDVGQAPNLYLVQNAAATRTTTEPARPGLARISARTLPTPEQNSTGSPGQNGQGLPPANLPPDLDPDRSGSKVQWQKPPTASPDHTLVFSNHPPDEKSWGHAWTLLVQAHADTTKAAFGLIPSKPDVRREHQQAMAECLVHAASDVQTKLDRLGVSRELTDIQRDLAHRAMRHYFKHDSDHLKRVKWALRDLVREIDARMIEAMQQLVRQTREEQARDQAPIDKPVVPQTSAGQDKVDNAREAQRIIAMLEAGSFQSAGPERNDKPRVEIACSDPKSVAYGNHRKDRQDP